MKFNVVYNHMKQIGEKKLLHIPLKKNFQCSNKNGSQNNFLKIYTLNLLKYSFASPKNQVLKLDNLSVCETAHCSGANRGCVFEREARSNGGMISFQGSL